MLIDYNKDISLPSDLDEECFGICCLLNRLPRTETYESCMGHYKAPFFVWFKCYDLGVISRLARAVDRNYSDGMWEVVADSNDTSPYGNFCLRSKTIMDEETLNDSLRYLIESITLWMDDKFDNYFSEKQ